ncbi:hypothetical protein [Perlabentimonas gracilis]|uniref:hypothetical protein n=1 Tax=Perlabentimonas gracilis TaxID=2715279 RepID=UPI00140C832B|nr:hypothetical protein [Perlabentimonas gracilis]NHB69008.1 hypothetical protein [Perlabentimonas gracilis]
METSVNSTSSNAKGKAVMLLTALIVVLTIVLAVVGYMFYAQHQESVEIQQQLNAEKDSIAQNLQEIMYEYDVLETDNEALQAKLEEEQERATKLYDELKQVRQVSYAKIKEYQRELGTLRSIMRDMVKEIDSLNTLNQQLIAENIKVRQEYTISQKTVESLEQRTEELSSAVERGSVVRARNINVVTINQRGREITRARNVDKIQTCFTLSENSIAKAGSRYVHIRILGPDGFILAKSNTDLFDFEGEKIVFSARREVDYQNKDVEMCIYYDNNGELIAGRYEVFLFMDGHAIGQGEFLLR